MMRASPLIGGLAALACVALAPCGAAAADYTFTDFNLPAGDTGGITGISQSGLIYGLFRDAQNDSNLFVADQSGAFNSFYVGPYSVFSLRANDGGELAGTTQMGNQVELFTLTSGKLATFALQTAANVTGIDDAGDIAGTGVPYTGDLDKSFGLTKLAGKPRVAKYRVPDSSGTWIRAVTSGFAIAGDYVAKHAPHMPDLHSGFVKAKGVLTTVVPPGRAQGMVVGMNDAGTLLVEGFGDAAPEATYLDQGGSFTAIVVPGASVTLAAGINQQGIVYGTYQTPDKVSHGFTYSAGTYTTVDAPGGHPMQALYGMDATGTLVGNYWIDVAAQTSQQFIATCSGDGC